MEKYKKFEKEADKLVIDYYRKKNTETNLLYFCNDLKYLYENLVEDEYYNILYSNKIKLFEFNGSVDKFMISLMAYEVFEYLIERNNYYNISIQSSFISDGKEINFVDKFGFNNNFFSLFNFTHKYFENLFKIYGDVKVLNIRFIVDPLLID